jgi:arylsulfatase A-like enzyme
MDSPNVLLLVFDSLRPDYLSCYSGVSGTTPAFERVANNGVVFEEAFSAGPNTEISHAALFSGRYPSETGMVGGSIEIPNETPLLADHLKNHGYRTLALGGSGKIRPELGFDRGFDNYIEAYSDDIDPALSTDYLRKVLTDSLTRRDLARTLSRGPDSLTNFRFEYLKNALQNDTSSPFFGFVNFSICHSPYDPPRFYKEEVTPNLSRPNWFILEFILDKLGYNPETLSRPGIRVNRVFQAARGDGGPYFEDSDWLTEEELDIVRKWYEASVEYIDAQLEEFLNWFYNSEVAEDTILVLTSDHGEHLGEHGLLYHGDFLYDQVLNVPLIISGRMLPDGVRRTDLASLVDIFSTITDIAGVPEPDDLSGSSLVEGTQRDAVFAEYGKRDATQSRFTEFYESGGKITDFSRGMKCGRTEENKLVLYSDGESDLYALPDETQPVDSANVKDELHNRIIQTLGGDFKPVGNVAPENNPKVRQNLRELGYID